MLSPAGPTGLVFDTTQVCTLTLCSVRDPAAAVAEVRRVLRPGGIFLFIEHVLSPTDAFLAQQQRTLTPLQVMGHS